MKHLLRITLLALCLGLATAGAWAIVPDPDPQLPPAELFPPALNLPYPTPVVSQPVDSIGAALKLANDETRTLGAGNGKVVIADETDTGGAFFYIEEDDRSSGVRVNWSGSPVVHRGDRVSVTGAMGVVDARERCISATSVTVISQDSFLPRPLAMNNKVVGGYQLNSFTHGVTPTPQRPESSLGPYNKGLLVMVSGRVMSWTGSDQFVLYDGDGLEIKVNSLTSRPAVGSYCIVTGVSSSYGSTTAYALLRVRDSADIVVNPTTEVLSSPSDILPTTTITGWAMIALPGVPVDPTNAEFETTPEAVLSSVLDSMPGDGLAGGNLFRWDAPSEVLSYYLAPDPPEFGGSMYCGSDGYIVKYDEAGTLTYRAVSQLLPETDRYIPLPAKNDSTMFGYPFTQPTDITKLDVTDGYRTLTLRDACEFGENWLHSCMFWWQADLQGQFDVDFEDNWPANGDTTLDPWHAYFINTYYNATTPAKYGLIIPSPAATLEVVGPHTMDLCAQSVQVRARLIQHGEAVSGQTINFSTTKGTLSNSGVATTDGYGIATITLSRETGQAPGVANVSATATVGSATVSSNSLSVLLKGWQITLDVSPANGVPSNTSANVTVTVVDENGAPVQSQPVTLTATQGTLGGTSFATGTDGCVHTTLAVTGITTLTVTASVTPCTGQTLTDTKNVVVIAHVMHVRTDGDDDNSGLSWEDAKATVQAAIADTGNLAKEVWVAKGTYSPTASITLTSDDEDMKLYGGFAGTETDVSLRNWAVNDSILDGGNALGAPVVQCASVTGVVIDGFTVCWGRSGGIFCSATSVSILNNRIHNNRVSFGGLGGGIVCWEGGSVVIAGNVINHNTAGYGAGIYVDQLDECTVTNNTIAYNYGQGIWASMCPVTIGNNIVLGNTSYGIHVHRDSEIETALSCNSMHGNTLDDLCIDIMTDVVSVNNIYTDPLLAPDNLHIQPNSPCRDAGDSSAVPVAIVKDADCSDRISGSAVDIGADESAGGNCYAVRLTMSSPEDPAAYQSTTVVANVMANVMGPSSVAVSGCQVNLIVERGQLTSVTDGVVDSGGLTGHGHTDSGGNVTMQVTAGGEGNVIVRAAVQQPCGGSASVAISDMQLVCCVDVSGTMKNLPYDDAIVNANDMVYELAHAGVPMKYGGVAFDNTVADPPLALTDSAEAFMLWTEGPGTTSSNSYNEEVLGALWVASQIAPGGYIALATDSPYHTGEDTHSLQDVVDRLTTRGCKVYIDATDSSACVLPYADLHVNGSIERPDSLGTWRFPWLRGILMP